MHIRRDSLFRTGFWCVTNVQPGNNSTANCKLTAQVLHRKTLLLRGAGGDADTDSIWLVEPQQSTLHLACCEFTPISLHFSIPSKKKKKKEAVNVFATMYLTPWQHKSLLNCTLRTN